MDRIAQELVDKVIDEVFQRHARSEAMLFGRETLGTAPISSTSVCHNGDQRSSAFHCGRGRRTSIEPPRFTIILDATTGLSNRRCSDPVPGHHSIISNLGLMGLISGRARGNPGQPGRSITSLQLSGGVVAQTS